VGQPLRSTRSAGLARRATGSRRCGIPVRASCPAGCPARCCDASTCRFSTGPRTAVGTSTRNGTGDRSSDARYTLGSSVGSGPATTHTSTVLREPGSRRLRSSLRTVPCSGRAVSISTATVAYRAADTGRISNSATSGRVRTTRHCSTTDVDEWSSIRGPGIVPVQAVNPDVLLDDAQPDDPAPAAPAATPGAAQDLTPVQPLSPQPLPVAPGQFAPAPLGAYPGDVFPQALGYGQPAPGYPQPGPGYGASVPNATTPYVMAPQPYGAGPRSPAHNSKIYGFDDSRKRPPGTLGKTYLRPTRMLDWDQHPRVG